MAKDLVGDRGCLSNHKECAKVNRDWDQAGHSNESLHLQKWIRSGTIPHPLL